MLLKIYFKIFIILKHLEKQNCGKTQLAYFKVSRKNLNNKIKNGNVHKIVQTD